MRACDDSILNLCNILVTLSATERDRTRFNGHLFRRQTSGGEFGSLPGACLDGRVYQKPETRVDFNKQFRP
jgi:hypothetical protein